MTATLPREGAPAGAPRPPAEPGDGRRIRRDAAKPTLRLPAELSLWVVTAAAALSFVRLFADRSFLGPVLAATALSHAIAALLRRRRVPVTVAAVASLLAMVLLLSWLFYFSTTRAGLPTSLTWSTFTDDLGEAVTRFREDQAPVEPVRGFVAGSAIGFWLVAFLGDWSAFRLWAPVESTIPAGSLFVFASLLGADQSRTVVTAVFFLAAVGFLLLHRLARLEMSPSWVRGDGRAGTRAQLAVGAGITAVALVGVAAVGPFLPGATSQALFDVKDIGNDDDTRITVSPLVDIKQRLVDQRETEVFRVTSPERAYWRLTALDEFDGRTWKSSKRFEKVNGNLPGSIIAQTFSISNLSQIWLPAAFTPISVSTQDRDVRWEQVTATLIVDEETSDGLEYTVTSERNAPTPEELLAATGPVPADIAEDFLTLPRRFPDRVRELAQDITAGASTPYQQAMALQDYFRGNYTYSTEVTAGQDIDAIEDFLFSDIRAGYCEQFAGSFAAMARSIGLPARVAVGFTPGDPVSDPENPDLYVVKGRHSHAWPEVYLAGIGWLLFEPTPGRGAPAAGYTGTSEQQDSDIAPNGSTTTTTAADPTADPTATSLPFDEFPAGGVVSEGLPEEGLGGGSGDTRAVDTTGARVVLVVLGLTALYVLVVPLVHLLRRRLRRSGARTPNARVDVAWREATDALHLIGVRQAVGETPNEFAVRADNRSRAGTQVRELAQLTTTARYAPQHPDERTVERATVLAAGVQRAVREQTTAGERIRAALDPRPLLRRGWHAATHGNRTDGDTEERRGRLVGSGSAASGTGGSGRSGGSGSATHR